MGPEPPKAQSQGTELAERVVLALMEKQGMHALAQYSRNQQTLIHKPTACFFKTEFCWNRVMHICLCICAAFKLEQQTDRAATNTL